MPSCARNATAWCGLTAARTSGWRTMNGTPATPIATNHSEHHPAEHRADPVRCRSAGRRTAPIRIATEIGTIEVGERRALLRRGPRSRRAPRSPA